MELPVLDALFDLDGCLYPIGNGLEEHVRERIFSFMVERLSVADAALAKAVWSVAFKRYNQSLRGLRACGYTLDADEYWRHIRGDSTRFLTPCPQVSALLRSLNDAGVRCWVYTNCREREAVEALEALHIDPALFRGLLGADFQARRAAFSMRGVARLHSSSRACVPHRATCANPRWPPLSV
jgi:phosphoglycolate phosphatase-like HAD superfamily hydrolase